MILGNACIATPETLIDRGAVVTKGETILWSGSEATLPQTYYNHERTDLGGRLLTPGLIDCHTHIVHGGHRAAEFEMRLHGATYTEIAQSGGGILSTLTATRASSFEDLITAALPRVDALIAEGVTTLEIKSGYGLDISTELNMLRAARAIAQRRAITVRTTFLGAHAIPPDHKGRPDDYLTDLCLPALEQAHSEGLVDAVDGFCENIAFTPAQIARVFDKAQTLGLPVKLHAEQLSHMGGTALACRYKALSADHLEYATEADAALMAASGTVAVILPGAFYTLCETQLPPIAAFRAHGVPMALSTDCNPGSSPLTSILVTMNMGCTLFRLTPTEALDAVTTNAARALGLTDRGLIAPDHRADLCVWNAETPAELCYRIGFNPLYKRIYGGTL